MPDTSSLPTPASSQPSSIFALPGFLLGIWKARGFGAMMAEFNRKDTHTFLQFVKYGICGVGALIVHTVIFKLLLKFVWPHLDVTPSTDPAERWNHAIATLSPMFVGFLFANAFVYWLNTKWVFTQGRHSAVREFAIFTLVNLPGAVGGALGQSALIAFAGWSPMLSLIGFVVPNAMINFVCRKFFIFKN